MDQQSDLLTPDRRQSKTLILLTSVDQKSLKTKFSIAICRQIGDNWQSKTLFLSIFYPRSSIIKRVLDCRLSGVLLLIVIWGSAGPYSDILTFWFSYEYGAWTTRGTISYSVLSFHLDLV